MKASWLTGFEPAQEYPNGFQVHRLNHSATTTYMNMLASKDHNMYLYCSLSSYVHGYILAILQQES